MCFFLCCVEVSAHWCPPCKAFTPKLAARYAKAAEQGKNFEIVFCSWDKNKSQFEEYFSEMPWLAIPYENSAVRDAVGDVNYFSSKRVLSIFNFFQEFVLYIVSLTHSR